MLEARRLGALLVAALVLVALAGVPLALLSTRDAATQHDAVLRMPSWLRSTHVWAASAALVLVALHVASVHVNGRARSAGRRVPLVGLGALALLLAVFLTGTILPWDQRGWEAFTHFTQALRVATPTDASAAPLGLVFWAHVLALPAMLVAGIVWHARRASWRADVRRVWAALDARAMAIVAIVVIALGVLFAPPLGPPPLPGIEITKPDWPFLWLVPLEDRFGINAVFVLPLAFVAAGLLLLRKKDAPRGRRVAWLVVISICWAALTLWGAL